MSSRQLHSHGESDGLSLPERARSHLINQKWTNKPHHNPADLVQPSYPQEIQLPLQPARLPELSPQHHKPLDLHKHQLPTWACCPEWAHRKYLCKVHNLGPLFTEDRLSTSSEQEICDQEVTAIICENIPTRSPAHTIPSRPGSIATVDCSTQGDPDQSGHSLVTGLVHEQTSILNTCNYLLLDGTGRRI